MTLRYTVGGVRFVVDTPLPDLPTNEFSDIELRASFTDDATLRSLDDGSLRLVGGPMGLAGAIDPDARECWLPTSHRNPADWAWYVRQMAPIFSAMLGRLVIHAGAVEIDNRIVAIVGESGAGKSTLVRYLTESGHRFASDDLLPIRFRPEPSAPVGGSLRPVGTILFLTRTPAATVGIDRLSALDAIQSLILHGFGEHADPSAWAFQFDAYHRITETVPVFNLTIPDDLDALADVQAAIYAISDGRPA